MRGKAEPEEPSTTAHFDMLCDVRKKAHSWTESSKTLRLTDANIIILELSLHVPVKRHKFRCVRVLLAQRLVLFSDFGPRPDVDAHAQAV